jgi:hypothetical protein
MNKVTRQEFLRLTEDEQLGWIEDNIEDYEDLLYGGGYLGCAYPVEQIDVAEYEEYRDDYGTSRLCQNKPPCPTASWKLTSVTCPILYLSAISKPVQRSSSLR